MKCIVESTYKGNKFWLKGTTWTSARERAQKFDNAELAQAALEKSKKFNAAAVYKAASIEEVA